jgi:hypothetical protein
VAKGAKMTGGAGVRNVLGTVIEEAGSRRSE